MAEPKQIVLQQELDIDTSKLTATKADVRPGISALVKNSIYEEKGEMIVPEINAFDSKLDAIAENVRADKKFLYIEPDGKTRILDGKLPIRNVDGTAVSVGSNGLKLAAGYYPKDFVIQYSEAGPDSLSQIKFTVPTTGMLEYGFKFTLSGTNMKVYVDETLDMFTIADGDAKILQDTINIAGELPSITFRVTGDITACTYTLTGVVDISIIDMPSLSENDIKKN